jgi:3-hydroxybutyryl-CoA dehydrogenase
MGDKKVVDGSGEKLPGRTAVIGAGLMGHGIAQIFAQKGYTVTLYDLHPSILEKALVQIRSNLDTFVEAGLEAEGRVEKVLSNIRLSIDLQDAVKGCQFITEAVPENLTLKTDLFEKLDRFCFPETILASNTSTLPISEFGKKVRQKDRLVITHWFNPPHIIPAVEVVRGAATSQQVFDFTFHLMKKLGKKPIRILREVPGFLINRVQTAMFREILSLLEQGVAEAEDIDSGVRGSFGLRLAVQGPLTTSDMGGLDLWCKGMNYLYPFLDRSTEVQKILKEKVERGEIGLKAGKGFFQYDHQEASALSTQSKERDKKLLCLLKTLSKEI